MIKNYQYEEEMWNIFQKEGIFENRADQDQLRIFTRIMEILSS